MPEVTIGPYARSPVVAHPDDADDIADLRTRLVDWMSRRGIDQWHHGEVGPERIRQQATRQEWWLVRAPDDSVVATVRIIDEDPAIWGPSDRRAIYVHGLMVDRRYAGLELGRQLLDWAANHARTRAVGLLRLDCVASNVALCDYYLQRGFTRVGVKQPSGNWAATALFETSISADQHQASCDDLPASGPEPD